MTLKQVKKDRFPYNYSHFIQRITFVFCILCIVTNKWIPVAKMNKPVSKETFIEALKVGVQL